MYKFQNFFHLDVLLHFYRRLDLLRELSARQTHLAKEIQDHLRDEFQSDNALVLLLM